MDSHALPTQHALDAAVRGAEAISALPAVPTPDWCDTAARALLPVNHSAAVILSLATLNHDGAVSRVEIAGAAAATVAEVATNVGRFQAGSTPIQLDVAHAGLLHLRSAASSVRHIGWTPGALISGSGAAIASQLPGIAPDGPLATRWNVGTNIGIGPVRTLLGAAWIGPPDQGRAVLVEMGLGETPGTSGEPEVQETMLVLGTLMPSLARRAALAFDPAQPIETQQLTTREEVVLRLLLEGKSVRIIAEDLGRSPHTVHDHVKSLHRKLSASTRGALVARALGHIRPGQTLPEPQVKTRSPDKAPTS